MISLIIIFAQALLVTLGLVLVLQKTISRLSKNNLGVNYADD